MPKIRYLNKTRQGKLSIYPKKSGDILQNMNFSRYYRNRGKVIYGFDPSIIISKKGSVYPQPVVVKTMQRQKKYLSILLTLALLFSFMNVSITNASKKLQLNKKKLFLSVGESYTLKVKNCKKKIKWSSSGASVKVNKKGKVTAKKVGKASVTAKAGKKKYVCKVTVTPKKQKDTKPVTIPVTPTPTPGLPLPTGNNSTPCTAPSESPKTLIYDLENETNVPRDENGNINITCTYPESDDLYYYFWICPAILYNETGIDYRGKKLHIELKIKNTGNRNLPELRIGFNNTFPTVYPIGYYLYDTEATLLNLPEPKEPDYDECIKEYENDYEKWQEWGYPDADAYYNKQYSNYLKALENYNTRFENTITTQQKFLPGQQFVVSFEYTIQTNAFNGDKDPLTGYLYPLQLVVFSNHLLDNAKLYQCGDEITITGCKISMG